MLLDALPDRKGEFLHHVMECAALFLGDESGGTRRSPLSGTDFRAYA